MRDFRPWLVIVAVLLAHGGITVFGINRINACGFSRRWVKRIEKAILVSSVAIPMAIVRVDWEMLVPWIRQGGWWPPSTRLFAWYGLWALAVGSILAIGWLESRWWLIPPRHLLRQRGERIDVHARLAEGSFASRDARWLGKIPGNQVGEIELNHKWLMLPRELPAAEGLRIAHLSDLHFTGQLRPEHYRFLLHQMQRHEPDLVILSGDVVDVDACLPWVEELLGQLAAPWGCGFVLGNHELRLSSIAPLVGCLRALGWMDLGARDYRLQAPTAKLTIELLGTERPWFERHHNASQETEVTRQVAPAASTLRIAVSHSPDQIGWARRCHADLMLAGHTHGGQIRIPGLGPIVAPSWFGSKFASGVFYLPPTLMHVSRGVSGIHPLRFRCRPEVSLLTLTNHAQTGTDASELLATADSRQGIAVRGAAVVS
ncbi:MAG: phosphoesterase [Pirellulaceae bacterium]|nr:MAG: phosphoesterase [Pirellulaceae bacterium]